MRVIISVVIVHLVFVFALIVFHPSQKTMRPKKIMVKTLILASPPLQTHSIAKPELKTLVPQPDPIKLLTCEELPPSPPPKQISKVTPKVVEPTQEKISVKKNEKAHEKIKPSPSSANQQKLVSLMQESLKTLEKAATTKKISTPTPSSFHSNSASKQLSCFSIAETNYQEMLVQYLQSQLSFPENGEVKIKLTLQRSGFIDQMTIAESSSDKNRHYIQKAISTLLLPEFGPHFKGESKHTFSITLTSKDSR